MRRQTPVILQPAFFNGVRNGVRQAFVQRPVEVGKFKSVQRFRHGVS
jgi:hypothetical protein